MTPESDLAAFQSVLREMDEAIHILLLVKGQLADGGSHYAYVSIPPNRYQLFKAAEAEGNYDLAEFGTILAHGEGLQPPPAVRERMEKEYGANHRFEEELQGMAKRLEKALREDKKND